MALSSLLVLAVGMAFTGTPQASAPAQEEPDKEKVTLQNKIVVFIKGTPGCGKTTIVKRICEGQTDRVSIELDPYKAKHGKKGGKARKVFIEDFTKHLDNEELKVVFVSMNNSNPTHYQDCVNIANEKKWKVMAINIADIVHDPKNNFINSAATGVLNRKEHLTVANTTETDKKKAYDILLEFVVMYEPAIQGEYGVHIVESLQWTKSDEPTSKLNLTYEEYIQSDVVGFDARRPIEDLIADVVGMIDKHIDTPMTIDRFIPIEVNRKPNPEQMYVKLKLSDEQQRQLMTSIPELENVPEELKRNFKHVTLMHKNGMKKNRELWLTLQSKKGTELSIVPYAYVYKENTVVVKVNVEDEQGNNVNDMVFSGVPHITGVLPSGVKPFQSKTIAEEATEDEIKNIEEQLRFTSIVE